MSDFPKYVVMHRPGSKGAVLRRCSGDNCYQLYVETEDVFRAQEIARKLTEADKPK